MKVKAGRNFVMIDREEPAMDAEFWQAVAANTPVEDYDSMDDVRRMWWMGRTKEGVEGKDTGRGTGTGTGSQVARGGVEEEACCAFDFPLPAA